MKRLTQLLLLLCLLTAFTACEKRAQMPSNKMNKADSSSAEMIKLNELLVEVEQAEIKAYIDSSKLSFKYYQTGYWIAKTATEKGRKIEKDDLITIAYDLAVLNGKTCYSYVGKKQKQLQVGKVEKQRGFNDALTQLQEGDEAFIIVPTNLAYGAIGDMENIPPRATLMYKIYGIKIITK